MSLVRVRREQQVRYDGRFHTFTLSLLSFDSWRAVSWAQQLGEGIDRCMYKYDSWPRQG